MNPNSSPTFRLMAVMLSGIVVVSLHGCGGDTGAGVAAQANGSNFSRSSGGSGASQDSATSWTIGCLDNQCIGITDSRFTAGQSFLVSTSSGSGTALGSYNLTADASNTLSFRPHSFGELELLGESGLVVSVAPSGATQSPITQFVALKVVTRFLRASDSDELHLRLNTSALAQSPSYSLEFLDSAHNSLQTVTGATPTDSTLTVNLSALQPAVATAYNGDGIYVVLRNSQNQALPGAYYTNANDMGVLNDFYSATQLQGVFASAGQGLLNVKTDLGYLLSPAVDVPYVSRFATEVPFAHTLSITRVLGGYTPSSVQLLCGSTAGATAYASYCTSPYRPWALDYVVDTSSSVKYQTTLLLDRLSPYLQAGYTASDLTLVLKNVPWTMASNAPPQNGSACVPQSWGGTLGQYGQCNPPASYNQWSTVITRLATDLQNTYQADAEKLTFAVGDEYDQTSNFNGQATDFYALYEGAYRSLKSVLPGAAVGVGDFTGACYDSASRKPGCVYDSKTFLAREVSNGDNPAYLARSLNSFWDMNHTPWPSAAVSSAVQSYAYVRAATDTPVAAEMHQFGLLHMPWGASGGSSVASLEASWEFQTLMGLKKSLPNLARVFNWGGFATIRKGTAISFLEGGGWIRTIMDNHQGAELYMLPVTTEDAMPVGNEVMAVAMVEGDTFQIIVSNADVVPVSSNLTAMQPRAPTALSIKLPTSWSATTNWSYLRYSSAIVDNVFAQVKRDLANAGILDQHFAQCAVCFSDPLSMATDDAAAGTILLNNWTAGSNYVRTMQNTLRWNAVSSLNDSHQLNIDQNGVTHAFSQVGGTLKVTIGSNEMLVLRPN